MSDLRLSGLATGLDTRALITQLMAFERRPVNLMEQTQAKTRSKINLYRQINTHMVALQRAAEKVMIAKFNAALAAKAVSSDPSRFSATATASAVSGTYNVDVQSLAKKQITGAGTFTSPTASFTMSNAALGTVLMGAGAPTGTFNLSVGNLARAQITGGGTYNTPTLSTSNSDPTKVSATVDATAISGTYAINVLNLAQSQQTGLGNFTTPSVTATVSDPTKFGATVNSTAAAGTYNVVVNSLAQTEQITGGTFNSPRLTATTLNNRVTATVTSAAVTAPPYAITNIQHYQAQVNVSGNNPGTVGAAGNLILTNSRTGVQTIVAVAAGDDIAAVAGKINGTAGVEVTAVAKTTNPRNITLTGKNGDGFTISDSQGGAIMGALKLTNTPTTTAAQAQMTIGTTTVYSSTDSFSEAQTMLAGVSLTIAAATVNGTGDTLTVTNETGSIRVTNTTTGAAQDVAVGKDATANDVAAAITAANVGLAATVVGGKLVLTGQTVGDNFTITDTVAGSGLANRLGIDTATPGRITRVGSQASVSIDGGAAITSMTNAFANVMPGVSLTVANTGAATLEVKNGSGTLRITNDSTGVSKTVAIALNASASDVATAINGANTGMTAAVVGGKLQLTGQQDGVSFTIDDAGGGNALAAALGIDSATKTTRVAANASISVNGGAPISSASTTFTGAIQGVTLNALAVGTSTLTIANGAGTLRITDTTTGTQKDVTVGLNATASDVANAINTAGTGMSATVNGSGNLVLTGNTTGTTYTIADAAGGNAVAASLGIDSATKTTQTALSATMTVNGGPAITSPTNQFVDPITGVTFTAAATGTSTLNITNNSGSIRITNDGNGSFVDVAIGNSTTAVAVANAINTANTGMTASVQSGKLVLTGNNAGDAFTIADAAGGNALATMIGIDSATKTTQTASLASISIDGGAAITQTSNTFVNPLTGVTIEAVDVGAATLTVTAGTVVTAQDEAEKKATLDAIRGMVNAFNDTMKFIKDNSSYDTTTRKAGLLLGDSMAASLRSGLTRMFNEVVDDQSAYRTAHSAGIQLQRDGTLVLDEDKLRLALEDDAAAVKALFTNEDGDTWDDAYGVAIKANTLGYTGSLVAGDGVANRLKAFVDTMVANASQYNATDGTGRHSRGTLLSRIDSAESAIKDLDRRIESYMNRLSKRQKTLEAKFAAMEKLVALMRNQGNYMATQYLGMTQQP